MPRPRSSKVKSNDNTATGQQKQKDKAKKSAPLAPKKKSVKVVNRFDALTASNRAVSSSDSDSSTEDEDVKVCPEKPICSRSVSATSSPVADVPAGSDDDTSVDCDPKPSEAAPAVTTQPKPQKQKQSSAAQQTNKNKSSTVASAVPPKPSRGASVKEAITQKIPQANAIAANYSTPVQNIPRSTHSTFSEQSTFPNSANNNSCLRSHTDQSLHIAAQMHAYTNSRNVLQKLLLGVSSHRM